MVLNVYWEWEFLIQTIKLGIKIAFVYDGILMLRLLFPHKNILVSIEDMVYWMYVTALVFRLQLEQSNGVLRGFAIAGIVLGMSGYNKLLGEKILALVGKWIYFVKRRLTAVRKILRIKLCKHKHVSEKSGREDGKKKNSSKRKKAKSSGHDTGIDGSVNPDAGGGCG